MQIIGQAGDRAGDPKANYRWGAFLFLKHSFFLINHCLPFFLTQLAVRVKADHSFLTRA